MTVHLPGISLPRMRIRMHGEFQRHNALLACGASWVVAASRSIAGTGFARAARGALAEAFWPGRYPPLPGRGNAGAGVCGTLNPAAVNVFVRELAKRRSSGNAEKIVAL